VLCHGVGSPEPDLQSANGKLSTSSCRAFEPAAWAACCKAALGQLHTQRRLSPVVSVAFAIDMNMKTSVI